VQIEGMKGLPASCTTPVAQGMKVTTQNKQLADMRRGVMELYISDHPLDCLTCPANGHCELQDMAGVVGLREVRYGYEGANHLSAPKDTSNPYFTFDASKCIVCSRCVRACDEQQGTLALTIQGRGFDSKVAASQDVPFMDSECVSCGACVQACPTATLSENTLIEKGPGRAQRHDDLRLLRRGLLVPRRDAGRGSRAHGAEQGRHANHGHSCVKGRFAIGYATHPDRITEADDPREDLRSLARSVVGGGDRPRGRELKRIQAKYGRNSIGGITSSRCTNEETYLVQKLVRAGFGNNNVDTCARVCHSPDRLRPQEHLGRVGRHAEFRFGDEGRRDLRDRRESHRRPSGVRLADEAPPAPGREADRRRSAHDRSGAHAAHPADISPEAAARHQRRADQQLAHVIVTEGLVKEDFVRERCEVDSFREVAQFIAEPQNSPEAMERSPACRPRGARRGAPLRDRRQRRDLLRPRRHRAQPGLDHGHGHRESRDGDRQRRPRGRRRQSRCAARTTCRAPATWAPSRTSSRATGMSRTTRCAICSRAPGASAAANEPGLRIPNMFEAALDGEFKGLYIEGEDIAQSDPNTQHVTAALTRWNASSCRTCS
jgi:formate dehydrogenase major subunit